MANSAIMMDTEGILRQLRPYPVFFAHSKLSLGLWEFWRHKECRIGTQMTG